MIPIQTDSRKIKKGDTFVAIKGHTVDGHDFIQQAILNGAERIICEHGGYAVETIVVSDSRVWLRDTLLKDYRKEVNELHLVGVTGTNGKTTTCFLTYQMLLKLGVKAAYIGTIGFFMGENSRELSNTTPEILELYRLLFEAKENGCTHVVMEVSSHSLIEKRIEGLEFEVEVFTNLTEDHLDFHKTMENYLAAKLLILDSLKPNGVILLNADDPYGTYFEQKSFETLGFQGNDYKIIKYEPTKCGTFISFLSHKTFYEVETNLKSKFNVYNYLSSVGILNHLGFSIEDILNITPLVYPPRGRCEQIEVGESLAVVDYAHTPDAVDKIISAFLEQKKGRIFTLVGCGGDRDPMKRPIMGKIATEKSDYVIFTSDNPRTEDPKSILEDILKGVKKENFEVEIDRKKAIYKGLSMLEKDDVLLILGKGHENYQILGHEKIHFDDLEEVKNYINEKRLS